MAKFSQVLLVEDDPITILVCERILKMTGFADEVLTCRDGLEAKDYLTRQLDTGARVPQIIFLDINMPVMNGWEFLAEFDKMKHRFQVQPPIYILSSTVDPEDFRKAEAHQSVKTFISKPLVKDHLEVIQP